MAGPSPAMTMNEPPRGKNPRRRLRTPIRPAKVASMSRRTKPPFRADHVGSLLRPREVLQARADREAGRISPKQLRVIEDKAIRQAVKMQEDAGLQAVTDGEMRRKSWHMDFLYRIGGMEKASTKVPVQFHGAGGDITYAAEGLR